MSRDCGEGYRYKIRQRLEHDKLVALEWEIEARDVEIKKREEK